MFGVHSKFIGGYYDEEKKRLILGGSNAMISVFSKNGKMNQKFDDSFRKWRRSHMAEYKLEYGMIQSRSLIGRYESGNLMYYDEKIESIIYLGSKYVIRIPSNSKAKGLGFAELRDMKSFLNISYDVSHWMYIYHQGLMVTLQKLAASAQRPFVMRIYTNDHL